ncbi:MAG TPA: PIG-L family deacetylase [Opitutaceae bacterium]|nr:PIG-L family deacetylase [Opitutaceae bacterium]
MKPTHFQFSRADADVFVPGGNDPGKALAQTTHLAIGAHQDDLEIFGYHGIAECFGHADRSFAGVVVTDGRGSPRSGAFAGITDDQMTAVRREEQRCAAVLGKFGLVVQLAHPSADVKSGARSTVDDLAAILGACRPQVLYTHNPADRHDTHVAVLLRTLEAVRRLPRDARPARVLGCEGWRDLDWLPRELRVALPVDPHGTLANDLVAVFESQIAGGKRYDLAVEGRRRANATFSDSHSVDEATGVILAMDLTALFHDDAMDPVAFAESHVNALKADVVARLQKLAGN